MKLEYKKCAYCGVAFDNVQKGMTPRIWAKRRYCGRKCGGLARTVEIVKPMTISFDMGSWFMRFVSGQINNELRG